MANSKRRRKEKVRRQAARAQRQKSADRHKRAMQLLHEAQRRMDLIFDPATPVEGVAEALREHYKGRPAPAGTPYLLREERGTPDDVLAIAQAVRVIDEKRAGGPSLTGLTFSAHAAYAAGDWTSARAYMDEALKVADEDETLMELAAQLSLVGRATDAINLVVDRLPYFADDEDAAAAHALAIRIIAERLEADPPPSECPCGSGDSWSACCQRRDAATLERFLDRSGLYALRSALREFLPGSDYEPIVEITIADWLETADADSWEEAMDEPLSRLAIEHAWLAAALTDEEEMEVDHSDNVLTALAADPATDPEIAERATTWRNHVRYGLWQIADPSPDPGLECYDLCTGQKLYVAFAPEQVERLPRWGVLLGAVVPLDGAWRATGTMIQVSPAEADALCETVGRATDAILSSVVGEESPYAGLQPTPFGQAEPLSVYAHLEDPVEPAVALIIGKVVGSLLPQLLAEVRAVRATPPTMTNTDGDPLILIKAQIAVRDGDAVASRLDQHPDFARGDDAEALMWYGKEVPAAQQETMLAELRAKVAAEGKPPSFVNEPTEPQRWVRGTLEVHGNVIKVEVNSAARLTRLIGILEKVGADPEIVDESRRDPAMDLPWPAGHRPLGSGMAPPEKGWERQWLDENVPTLRGKTPREAARGDEWVKLEALLRQFEFDADLLGQSGQRGIDTDWLREQLGMPDITG